MARSFLPAIGVAFLFSSTRSGDAVTFHPTPGATIHRTVSQSGEFQLDDLSVIVDDQDMGQFLGALEMTIEQQSLIEVADVYVAVGEGRPTKLLRTFETLTGSSGMTMTGPVSQSQDNDTSSRLEGETVVFTWNGDEGAFDVAFEGDDGDDELLEGLAEDMDLRSLLPEGEVAVDDSWEVPIESLKALAQPGGNLHMMPDDSEISAEDMKVFEDMFADIQDNLSDLLDGSCTCTYKGRREVDGVAVAEIEVEVGIASTINLSGFLETLMEKIGEEAGEMPEMSIDTADLNLDFEGTGTLLWHLEAGRPYSFHLQGDISFGIDFAISIEAEGERHAVDASVEISGTVEQEYETE